MSDELERRREVLDSAVRSFMEQKAIEDSQEEEGEDHAVTADDPLLVTAWLVSAEGLNSKSERGNYSLRYVSAARGQMTSTSLGLAVIAEGRFS